MVPWALDPASVYEADVRRVSSRAKLAMGALGLTAFHRLLMTLSVLWLRHLHVVRDYEREIYRVPPRGTIDALRTNEFVVLIGYDIQFWLFVLTVPLFLCWLHQLVKTTRALGADALGWTPVQAVLDFFIPVFCMGRPFLLMDYIQEYLVPDMLPEPKAQVVATGNGNYRAVRLKEPPIPGALPHGSLATWWGFFWAGNFLCFGTTVNHASNTPVHTTFALSISVIANAIQTVSAILCILVVRSITCRLLERYRRVAHASPETLASAGITLGAP